MLIKLFVFLGTGLIRHVHLRIHTHTHLRTQIRIHRQRATAIIFLTDNVHGGRPNVSIHYMVSMYRGRPTRTPGSGCTALKIFTGACQAGPRWEILSTCSRGWTGHMDWGTWRWWSRCCAMGMLLPAV